MRFKDYRFKEDYIYLLPISDLHIGDKNFNIKSIKLLQGNIQWVKNQKNAFVFLNGDILNVATRTSKSSQSAQNMNLHDQIEFAIKLFKPIKDRILGAIDGNHCQRMIDDAGYSPLSTVCGMLNVPYFGNSVVLKLVVGTGKRRRNVVTGTIAYSIYFHHTTGGGATVGGKMNRIDKLRRLICNCDAYIGSHNHQLGVIPVETRMVDTAHNKITKIRQLLIDTGSYLHWDDGYAEAKQLEPSKLGSPRIRLSGGERDIHASV